MFIHIVFNVITIFLLLLGVSKAVGNVNSIIGPALIEKVRTSTNMILVMYGNPVYYLGFLWSSKAVSCSICGVCVNPT